jgi:hypothetical protein
MTVQPRLSRASITVTFPLHGKRAGGRAGAGGRRNRRQRELTAHQGEDRAAAGGHRHGEQVAPAVCGGGLADCKRPGRPPVFPASAATHRIVSAAITPGIGGWRRDRASSNRTVVIVAGSSSHATHRVAGPGRRQEGRYSPVPSVIVLHVQQRMFVQRGADERSTDGSGRVLAWPGPRTRAPASDYRGRDAPPRARR